MSVASELMTTSVPKAQPDETASVALERLREQKPEEAGHLYLIDEAFVLTGQVPIERLLAAAPETRHGDLRGDPPIEVHPDDDAEMVALLAVERHDADVAVVDDKRGLIGAIPIGRLLRLLHEAHVDEILRRADVSLIVMGICGRHQGGIEEILFGSTAEKVLRAARIPVVRIPPGTGAETNKGTER